MVKVKFSDDAPNLVIQVVHFLLLFSDSLHTGVLYSSREFSIDLKELHFKSQISMRWDDTPSTFCPVSIITGDLQECLFTETH